MPTLWRSARRMLGATSRARAHVVDGVRATRVFADPVALLSAYVRGAGLHGSVVRLRDGVEIETSSSALDPATLMVVLVREEYAPIPVGGLVVDVGGNIGAFALYAVRAGARRVLTFEPSRDAYAVLRRNVQRNGLAERIVAERRAVVGRAGEDVWFPTASSPANHIIDDPAALEAARAAGSVERVPTTSLAEIVDAHGEIDLLKLDCEGAEYGIVAATPAAAWARVGSVRIEYHAGQAEELTFTLVRHGFRVSRHAPDPAWPKAIGMLHLERTYRARSAAPARPLREARGANGTTSAGGRMGDDWKRIDEQVLVITGGSSGIGLATARLAVEAGARVVLAARDRRALRRATDRLRAHGEVVWVDADVGDPADVEEIGRAARRRFGGVDTWVNGAGVTMFGRLDELSLADQRRLFDTNFWGVVHGCRVAVPLLRARGRGVIVNVGSGLSDAAVPLQGIYSASKHAVQGFTDALRMELELADEPIAVTLVKPASIDTPIYDRARNYLPTEPEPIRPVYAPEVAARAILSAAERPVRDVFAGGGAKGLAALRHGAPRLADVVGEQLLAPQEAGHRPARPRADNLWRPADVPVAERAQERGSFEGRVHGRSAYTAATQRPGVTALVAAGIGLAVAAGVRGLVGGARPEERPARGDAP